MNNNELLLLAQLSNEVYKNEHEINVPPGLELVKFIDIDGTQCAIFKYPWNDYKYIVVFRGTEEIKDLMTDLNTGFNKMGVHKGFFNALFIVLAIIELRLPKAIVITFTGHSLGGALATIAANYFALDNNNICKCITFASPMVGNIDFVTGFNEHVQESIRVVNNGDPIVCLPGNSRNAKHPNRYVHVKGELRIGWPRFLAFFRVLVERKSNHQLTQYIETLKKMAKRES